MRRILILLLPALLFGQSRLLRHPSYHSGKVAFSYLGDIWVANENGGAVHRLTDHAARDVYPRFSPDGAWIAFSSNRYGNNDVFVVRAEGGTPRQLTFHTADDTVVGWSPDSRKILFTSVRGGGVFPTVPGLFLISADRGLEERLPTDWGAWASYSPDGTRLALARHNSPWSRKHYRGSFAWDLWVMETAAKKFTKLSDDEYKGNWLWPMYGRGGEIYFVADRLANEKNIRPGTPEVMQSVNNIWKISDRGGRPVQVTHHTSGSLFYPSISADRKVIVYEENFGLWKLDIASGKSTEIRVKITTDPKENVLEWRAFRNEADSFSLSPSTRRAAISTHGEIFSIATDRGEVRRVTATPWREQNPRWSPNGKLIAFTSDRTGRQEIWVANEYGENLRKLTDADTEKLQYTWSPDSRWLAFTSSDKKLWRLDVESGKTGEVAAGDAGNISDPQFSPDGKWISYVKRGQDLRSAVYINAAEGGAEHKLDSDDLFSATDARWTPDGKKLLVIAGVSAFNPVSSQGRPTMQLYSVSLTREEKGPASRDIDSEEEAQAAPQAAAGRRGGGEAERPKAEVKIDWDGIGGRIRQLTRGNESVGTVVPSPDGRLYAFVAFGGVEGGSGGATLYTITEDGERITRIASAAPPSGEDESPRGRFGGFGVASPQWARDGRSIYYQAGSAIYSAAVPETAAQSGGSAGGGGSLFGRGGAAASSTGAPAASQPRRLTFTVRLEIDRAAERRQVFQEAWRVMKHRFYDAKMHGVNWAAMKDKYEPLLADVADGDELRTVIMQMIGELNASHTGISAGREPGQEPLQTRYPGFDIEPDASGYYKVSYVYKKGPAGHEYVKIAPGNFILAVNGKELKTTDNYWQAYNLIPGRKFEFLVNSKPAKEGAWTVKLEPLSGMAFGNLQYQRWVDEREQMVAKLTGGEIGYLHIRAMDAASLRKFERDLTENRFKKALIIDERFNGGGNIDQELLGILVQRRKYQALQPRDSVMIDRPARGFFGHMVVLHNERSASDAEMFPDGFRALGLGKLVGVPTYGAVIGTGAYRMLDGSSLRTPGSGVYTAKGANMENFGVQPDVWVDNTPEDFLAGRDAQILKAIEVLKAELKK